MSIRKQRVFVSLILVLAATSASFAVTPARAVAQIPDVQVLDDTSQSASLSFILNKMGNGPVIVLPIFTRCSASCPVLTRKLADALQETKSGNPDRIVLFSFDPLETSESVRLYRVREHVPADWKIVRSNEAEIRRFVDFFHYSVMNQDGALLHPNEIFILDQSLNWRWTLVGEDWSSKDLATALELTRAPGLYGWMKSNPQAIAWIGFAAMILSLGIAMVWMILRKPATPPLAA